MAVRDIDRVIAGLASRQRGVVSRAQLVAAGIHTDAIKLRVRSGRLHPLHRGVYLVGHRTPMEGAREMGAVLACGPGAVVSHRTAAEMWRLLPYPAKRGPVDVTVSARHRACRPGIRIHCVAALDDRDRTTIQGIPVSTPARTLLDLTAVLPPPLLERAIADADVRHLARRRDLIDQLERNPGRRGTRVLRRVLDLDGGPALTSEAERRLLALIRAAELPMPLVNSRVGIYEVDLVWPDHKLVVEVDGFAFHSSRAAFERDRQRDSTLAASGYTVIRVTWRQLVDAAEAVIARIAAALAGRE